MQPQPQRGKFQVSPQFNCMKIDGLILFETVIQRIWPRYFSLVFVEIDENIAPYSRTFNISVLTSCLSGVFNTREYLTIE